MTRFGFSQSLFHALLVRPLVWFALGLNVRHRERLPRCGPAIIVANHNNHLDTFVLMSLFPLSRLGRIRAVVAADYFLRTRSLEWLARNMFRAIPVKRDGWTRGDGDPLADCAEALARGEILIVYPEGTRGEPEQRVRLKPGVAHLAKRHPDVPVYPVFLHGLGKVLPKGSALFVPLCCDVFVGEPIRWNGGIRAFLSSLTEAIDGLEREGNFPEWR
ncbi:MAG: lysophospholipid acyltransferase family protein [Alphaproteobacteria bacterium]